MAPPPAHLESEPTRRVGLSFLVLTVAFLFISPRFTVGEERVEEKDTNEDGKPDEWLFYTDGVPVRMERDADADGRRELVIFLEILLQEGKPVLKEGKPVPRPIRAEMDRNGDGKPDFVRVMESGIPVRDKGDYNFDGKWDIWSYYKDGFKDFMIMDKNYDGKPDAWFYYVLAQMRLNGGRVDTDFDGTVDRTFGEVPQQEDRQPWE